MTDERKNTGRKGEDQACTYLESLGHTIVARNWRSGHLELDIVSTVCGELHFVEVKSRTAPVVADPVLNVSATKQKHMVSAAKAFLNSEDRGQVAGDLDICFDAVTVVFHKDSDRFEIEYYPKAFYPIYV